MQAHHRALGKPKERQLFWKNIFIHHQGIEKGVQIVNGGIHTPLRFFFA